MNALVLIANVTHCCNNTISVSPCGITLIAALVLLAALVIIFVVGLGRGDCFWKYQSAVNTKVGQQIVALQTNNGAVLRTRHQDEDKLLNERTRLVLVLNGFAGISVEAATDVALVVAVVMIVINILWLNCARDACWVMACLKRRMELITPNAGNDDVPDDERFRWVVQDGRFRWPRSTRFMSQTMPLLLLMAWLFGLCTQLNDGEGPWDFWIHCFKCVF